MTDSSDDRAGYAGSPGDAFSVLGDETRLRILLELAEGFDAVGGGGLSFSELRERVGVEDSGRFNYHLDTLTGGFVGKQDGEYVPKYPGLAVVSAVYAGLYSGETDEQSADSGYECPTCGRAMRVHIEQNTLRLACEEHGDILGYPTPPGAWEGRSLTELAPVAYLRATTELDMATEGICLRCWGQTEVTLPVSVDIDETPVPEEMEWARVRCERCWLRYRIPVAELAISKPVVQGLLAERGAHPRELSSRLQIGHDTTVHEAGGVTVTFGCGDETVAVDLDEEAQVLSTEVS